jgi:hypothetical protein
MIIAKVKTSFDGEVLINLLKENNVEVANSSLGVPVPSIDGNGNLELLISETDLVKVKSLLAEYLVS